MLSLVKPTWAEAENANASPPAAATATSALWILCTTLSLKFRSAAKCPLTVKRFSTQLLPNDRRVPSARVTFGSEGESPCGGHRTRPQREGRCVRARVDPGQNVGKGRRRPSGRHSSKLERECVKTPQATRACHEVGLI